MKKRLIIFITTVIISSLLITQSVNYAMSNSELTASEQKSEIEQTLSPSTEVTLAEKTAENATATANVMPKKAVYIKGMEIVAENEALVLYLNSTSTEIAVFDKNSGVIWYSNPQDRAQDNIATGYNKDKLNVQFELTYYDPAGNTLKYDNYTHSVQNQQFEVKKVDGGMDIVYTLGEVKSDIDAIPKWISAERFQSLILDKLDDKGKKEILKRFRLDEDSQRYERRDSSLKGVGLSKVTGLFKEVGYDEAQIAIDKAAYGENQGELSDIIVPLQYRLVGKQLRVTVPEKGIQYSQAMKIQTLSLLPFFGASGVSDQGYSLVPDGSGSLIYFNNGKSNVAPYNATLYGMDKTFYKPMKNQKDEVARLPVFGMKYENHAFLGIIDKGDAVASVEADVSGRLNQYNTVYPSFTLNSIEEVTLTNGWRSSTVKKFQSQPFHSEIAVAYQFLGADQASYSGMAESYRNYLEEQQKLTRLEANSKLPFYVEFIGGIPKKKFFLGIPYHAYESLTTFEQAQKILTEMQGLGIDGIQLRYTGWFNGGIHHNLPNSVSVDSKLGGRKGLSKLETYAKANHIGLYPDVSFLESFPDAEGFKKAYASRLITNKLAAVYPFRISTLWENDEVNPGYVLSPKVIPQIISGFLEDYRSLNLPSLSLRDLGNELNSDFNREDVINREEAKGVAIDQLKQMTTTAPNLLIEGGNAYATPFAKHIVNAPISNSRFNITDEAIPFFQMVYHGSIQYTGEAWNLGDDQDSSVTFLKALETGSSLHYTWFYADPSAIKMTDFDHFYSADYRRWINEAAELYQKLNDVVQDVQGQVIQKHEKLAEGVYQTTFEQGKRIIVNYNDAVVKMNGVTVEPKGYWVGGDIRQ
ncbi:hypothetical protein J2Z32_004050 [Paenibacillus turicensis]|uniref:Glycosyl hydrolase-like 10 domain-containing protein n=1 Tax=Paenibacillus turicensis TaxID=160487 RepID=A0ABS4FXY3_9BACL|nr:DUF5696 domain-containing protein [Paenibacillus turicensis]MBP1907375.1 hypothetical protein [Paenibacillus turicensis]